MALFEFQAIHDLKSIMKLNDSLPGLDEHISQSFAVYKGAETLPTDKQTEDYLNSVFGHYSSKLWDTAELLAFFDEGQELSRKKKHKVFSSNLLPL